MKHLKAEIFLVETVDIKEDKFVKVGTVTGYLQELYRDLRGKNRIWGLETLIKKKIRENQASHYEKIRNRIRRFGNGAIILTSKKMIFCKTEREWQNILEDRCARCGQVIEGLDTNGKIAHFQSPRPDLCMGCYIDWRGD